MHFIKLDIKTLKILNKMKQKGVPIFENKLAKITEDSTKELEKQKEELFYNYDIEPSKARTIAKYCDSNGVEYTTTSKGNPSFTSDILEKSTDSVLQKVNEVRKLDKLVNTFLIKNMAKYTIDGCVYPSYHIGKSEIGGTLTGRLSCSNPNIQQIPKKSVIDIRSLFGREGYDWYSLDYSQIELRLFAYYSKNQDLIDSINAGEDLHQVIADMLGISRSQAKTITFGFIYGMGVKLFCKQLDIPEHEGLALKKLYFEKIPAIEQLLKNTTQIAESRGYVKTLTGRRRNFNLYSIPKFNDTFEDKKQAIAVSYARGMNGNIQVFKSYRALNSIIQGTASDIFKIALVKVVEKYDYDDFLPVSLVHDEINFCIPKDFELLNQHEIILDIKNIMQNAIKLPVKFDCSLEWGDSWGELREYEYE